MTRERGRGRLDRALDRVAAWLLPDPAADAAEELKHLVRDALPDDPEEKTKKG